MYIGKRVIKIKTFKSGLSLQLEEFTETMWSLIVIKDNVVIKSKCFIIALDKKIGKSCKKQAVNEFCKWKNQIFGDLLESN